MKKVIGFVFAVIIPLIILLTLFSLAAGGILEALKILGLALLLTGSLISSIFIGTKLLEK